MALLSAGRAAVQNPFVRYAEEGAGSKQVAQLPVRLPPCRAGQAA